MKKNFLLLISLFFHVVIRASINPLAYYYTFGLNYSTDTGYSQYIGQRVVYYSSAVPEYFDKSFGGEFSHPYVITKVTNSGSKYTLTLKDESSNKEFPFVFYNEAKYKVGDMVIYENNINNITTLPLFLIDKFNEEKSKIIGNKYGINNQDFYKIIDIDVTYLNNDPVICKRYNPTEYRASLESNRKYGQYPTVTAKIEYIPTGNVQVVNYFEFIKNDYYREELLKVIQNEIRHKKISEEVVPVEFDDSYEIVRVYEEKGTKDELYSKCQTWIAKRYKDYKSVVQTEDPANSKIIIKGKDPMHGVNLELSGIISNTTMNYNITLECKDGRYRVTISDIVLNYDYLKQNWHDTISMVITGCKNSDSQRNKILLSETKLQLESLLYSLKQNLSKQDKSDW